ncbi:MAG: ribosomal RNA small subunit methyltransferase A [Candidatus Nealsonbacteria bacterium]|nr:ribosomal RNA small subunit methyltransferase A [Candidatus Nealsonbacteria bacterium]
MRKSPGQGQSSFRPQKGLGQNFLRQKGVLNQMVVVAEINSQDLVLEIGPGLGSLTQALAQKARRVVAIEKDGRLIPILSETLQGLGNVEIILGDALKLNWSPSMSRGQRYKLVANLPYYITQPIIRRFLEAENPPELMVLLLQKEVAQRICARPGEMSLLAASVQFYAEAKIVDYVSKRVFWPKPKVDGAIIKIIARCPKPKADGEIFFKIVRAGFSQPRKQLLSNLSRKLDLPRGTVEAWLAENRISARQRPADLSLSDWLALAKTLPQPLFS